jgi:nitrate/nitrite-specific signal transduction histidine kinase
MGLILKFNIGLMAIFLSTFPLMDFAVAQASLDDRLLGGLMVAAWCLALNLLLGWTVLRPVRRLTRSAERLSVGHFDEPELADSGGDEIARLAGTFNRLRRRLESTLHPMPRESRP